MKNYSAISDGHFKTGKQYPNIFLSLIVLLYCNNEVK